MGNNLEKVGVRLVAEDANPFNKALDNASKRVADFTKQTTQSAKAASPLSSAFQKLGISVDGLRDKLLGVVNASGPMGNALVQLAAALGPLTLAVAAVTAGIVAFIALATRGAGLRGLAESFDLLTASVGVLSTTLLQDLRRAAAGTVSDFDLIRAANLALAGATGEFGQMFAQNLPRILEIARAQARATGQDVNYLFDSLVRGIKRSSPMLIDNTGLVLKIGEANEAYAESIGKTVDQLTQQEQQMAILQATLDAGAAAIEMSGQIQETAAEKLARAGATVTNIFDKLALAVQPAFEAILDVINRVLSAIDQLVTAVLPIIQQAVTNLAAPFVAVGNAVMGFVEPLVNLASNVIPYVIAAVQILQDVFGGLINFLWGLIEPLVRPIIEAFQRIGAFISNPENVRQMFMGAARFIGALANGMMAAANQYVFPTVIAIARFIADFLMGLSPPPKGPLSTIDKGGENLMLAWLEGITGVSLDPVKKVAAEVAAAMGNIGTMSREQVEGRLRALDAALQPFSDRLAIVKSQFDALREPAEAALRAIDRQMETAVQALLAGDQQAAATVRALDSQREAIEGALAAQQNLTDAAQVQLSLATAQQARERTLLEIRKRMLGPVTAAAKKAKDAAGGKLPKEAKVPAGGGAPAPQMPGGGAPIGLPEGDESSVLDLIGGQGAIDAARQALEEGFISGFDPTTVGAFNENLGLLQTELGRIGEADIGGRISEGLAGIRGQLDTALNEAFEGIRHFFVDPGEGTLDGLLKSAENWFMGLPGRIITSLAEFWTLLSESEPILALRNFFTLQGEDETTLSGILFMGANWFRDLPVKITDALGSLWMDIVDGPLAPLIRFFGTEDEYSLAWLLQQGVDFFATLPERIAAALSSMGDVVWTAVVLPVIGALNGVISAVEEALRNLVGAVIDLLSTLLGGLDSLIDLLGLNLARSGDAPIIRDLQNLRANLNLPRVSTTRPAVTGGIFGKGLMRVGEHGPEGLMNAASKTAVFPSSVMRSMDALTGAITTMVAQPAAMPIPGGNSYNDDHSMNMTFNGIAGNRDAVRRWRVARAMGR